MCLSRVGKLIPHKVGYKILDRDYNLKDWFTSQYYFAKNFHYTYGFKYDAHAKGRTVKTIYPNSDGQPYKEGFHYYLRLKDAKVICYFENDVIAKIIVEDNIACGTEGIFKVGVSRFMTIVKIY